VTCGIGSFLFCDDVLLEVTGAILLGQVAVLLILSVLAVTWMCNNPDKLSTPPSAKQLAKRDADDAKKALIQTALETAKRNAAKAKKGGKQN